MLGSILKILATLFGWLTSPEHRKAQEKARKEDAVQEVRKGDAKAVNKRLDDLLKVVIVSAALALPGCVSCWQKAPAVDQAVSETEASPLVVGGVKGWFVPNPLMERIMAKLEETR